MSAPLVVNTTDGTVWTRREAVRDGLALYAPEKCGGCPEFVMATYAELEGHGVTGSADVLPVPVGPEPRTLDVVEHELTGARLSLYEEELETARLRLALKSAQRGRSRLRARVAELEAERHSTNEALDDAVQALRADATPSLSFAERAAAESDSGRRAAWRMLAEPEPEFDAYLRHPYRTGHDLPETGGV